MRHTVKKSWWCEEIFTSFCNFFSPYFSQKHFCGFLCEIRWIPFLRENIKRTGSFQNFHVNSTYLDLRNPLTTIVLGNWIAINYKFIMDELRWKEERIKRRKINPQVFWYLVKQIHWNWENAVYDADLRRVQ